MNAAIKRTKWGWSLTTEPTIVSSDGLVASADHAEDLWPLALALGLVVTA